MQFRMAITAYSPPNINSPRPLSRWRALTQPKTLLMFPLSKPLSLGCGQMTQFLPKKMQMTYKWMTVKRVSRKAVCFPDEVEPMTFSSALFSLFWMWTWSLKHQQPLHFSSMGKDKKIRYNGFDILVTNKMPKSAYIQENTDPHFLKTLWIRFPFPCNWKLSSLIQKVLTIKL